MSKEIELPPGASQISNPPTVTVYAGPESARVKWFNGTSRMLYQINVDGPAMQGMIILNRQQAYAVAVMLAEATEDGLEVIHDGQDVDEGRDD